MPFETYEYKSLEEIKEAPVCNRCKNHIKGIKCKAFEVIPDSIIFGKNDHSQPLPDQGNDIVFEPV